VIDVEPLDNGDPDLYLVQGKNNRPTTGKYLMKSTSFKGDHLTVTSKDLEKVGLKDMNGYFVVGVYGFRETKFTLKWKHSNTTVNQGQFLKPLFLDLKENATQYIELFHFMYRTPITIKIASDHAHVVLLINKIDRDSKIKDYYETFPWLDDHLLRIDLNREQSIAKRYIGVDDPVFCDNCRYLMTIFTEDPGAKVEFLATYQTNFSYIILEPGKQLIDTLDKDGEQKYKIENENPDVSPDIDVNILHGKMEFYSGHNIMLSTTNFAYRLNIDEGRNFIRLNNNTVPDGPATLGFLGPNPAVEKTNNKLPLVSGVFNAVKNFVNHLQSDTYVIAKCVGTTNCLYKVQSKLEGQ
jgi:hypothetical protein